MSPQGMTPWPGVPSCFLSCGLAMKPITRQDKVRSPDTGGILPHQTNHVSTVPYSFKGSEARVHGLWLLDCLFLVELAPTVPPSCQHRDAPNSLFKHLWCPETPTLISTLWVFTGSCQYGQLLSWLCTSQLLEDKNEEHCVRHTQASLEST